MNILRAINAIIEVNKRTLIDLGLWNKDKLNVIFTYINEYHY